VIPDRHCVLVVVERGAEDGDLATQVRERAVGRQCSSPVPSRSPIVTTASSNPSRSMMSMLQSAAAHTVGCPE
jgi:hypothetical protein